MKVAVVTPISVTGERGGAENLYEGLVNALNKAGHDATQVEVPVDESTFEGVLDAYCRCFYMDLNDYDLVISTKSPTYMVQHRNHISYLLHTMRVFYDMFELEFDPNDEEKQRQRRLIHAFDRYGLDPGRVKRRFVNGSPVYERMEEVDDFWKHVRFEVLHHPPKGDIFKEPQNGQYIFFPSRLHHWKRPDLIINAMRYVDGDINLIISGRGSDERRYRELAKDDSRIQFIGWIDDETLIDLYSKAIVVPFVPIREDYGLITIEAFKSKKPVLTCFDSGEPANIVKDGINGFIVEPTPQKIAEKINYLVDNPVVAKRMGENGYQTVRNLTWDNFVSCLLSDEEPQSNLLLNEPKRASHRRFCLSGKNPLLVPPTHMMVENDFEIGSRLKVLVADNQVLDPPIGGGRVRIYQLYKNFNPEIFDITYLGTFDWLGPEERRQKLAEHFTEILVPMTVPHIAIDKAISTLCGGKTTLDVTTPLLMHHTPRYQRVLSEQIRDKSAVIVSHPWVYPTVKKEISKMNKKPLLIYDAHNVEYKIKRDILNSSVVGKYLTNVVKNVEGDLVKDSDLVFVCSSDDAEGISSCYGPDKSKILVIPNGASVQQITVLSSDEKKSLKDRLGFDNKPIAAFLASGGYAPNDDAAEYICRALAPELPMINFVFVGSVCNSVSDKLDRTIAPNVTLLGVVSDKEKGEILSCSDIALNPVIQGSGTNIKVFDYLSAGLPVITTPVGARGIDFIDGENGIIVNLERFAASIIKIVGDAILRDRLSKNARVLAEKYDWRRIAATAGERIVELSGDTR